MTATPSTHRPLAGKAVVLTGAGRGIGEACAHGIASLGGAVLVNDLDAERATAVANAIRDRGGIAAPFAGDITDALVAEEMIATCEREFERIDGLVNNAGVIEFGRLEEGWSPALTRQLNVNVIGAFNCASSAIRRFYARGEGAIVNVTSGAQTGMAGLGAYGATKGAVASLTYAWAVEVAGTGVRVNAISPMAETRMSTANRRYWNAPATSPLPPPEANVAPVAFLLSERAKGINGQILRIDGARLSLMTHPSIRLPIVEETRGLWTYERVSEAFDEFLKAGQVPEGLAWLDVARAGPVGPGNDPPVRY